MKSVIYSLLIIFVLASCGNKETEEKKNTLLFPVIGPKKLNNGDTMYHTIAPFSFTNQFGEKVSDSTTKDKIYIANFFFATCQSICPRMNTQLGRVAQAYNTDNEILFLSHTINPSNDTVEVLAQYGAKYGAVKNKWHLLTGPKPAIYDLAKTSYLINAVEDDGTAEGFIHSEFLLLIDKQKRIRGTYDGTDSIMVNKLIEDIKLLKTEK
ncbi:MAG: SCO family protein [Bacteroidetes bacterium]|nr:SCO family protein [Bacteroidota bacterium]